VGEIHCGGGCGSDLNFGWRGLEVVVRIGDDGVSGRAVSSSFDLRGLISGLVGAVYPPQCSACGAIGCEPFCSGCALGLEPVPPFVVEGATEARALWVYGGPVAVAIHRFKYRAMPELGRPLGQALAPLAAELAPIDALVPVPLSAARLLERGYNQARELTRAMPLPVLSRALIRRVAREQVGLTKRARWANVSGTKGAILPGPDQVSGLRVALVDDVVTTGATARACVAALHRAGVRSVAVLSLARAL
jgi:ComF family protein